MKGDRDSEQRRGKIPASRAEVHNRHHEGGVTELLRLDAADQPLTRQISEPLQPQEDPETEVPVAGDDALKQPCECHPQHQAGYEPPDGGDLGQRRNGRQRPDQRQKDVVRAGRLVEEVARAILRIPRGPRLPQPVRLVDAGNGRLRPCDSREHDDYHRRIAQKLHPGKASESA